MADVQPPGLAAAPWWPRASASRAACRPSTSSRRRPYAAVAPASARRRQVAKRQAVSELQPSGRRCCTSAATTCPKPPSLRRSSARRCGPKSPAPRLRLSLQSRYHPFNPEPMSPTRHARPGPELSPRLSCPHHCPNHCWIRFYLDCVELLLHGGALTLLTTLPLLWSRPLGRRAPTRLDKPLLWPNQMRAASASTHVSRCHDFHYRF